MSSVNFAIPDFCSLIANVLQQSSEPTVEFWSGNLRWNAMTESSSTQYRLHSALHCGAFRGQ